MSQGERRRVFVDGLVASEPITPHEAKCIRLALAFGDPALENWPDPDLERAKAKLAAIERGDARGRFTT